MVCCDKIPHYHEGGTKMSNNNANDYKTNNSFTCYVFVQAMAYKIHDEFVIRLLKI